MFYEDFNLHDPISKISEKLGQINVHVFDHINCSPLDWVLLSLHKLTIYLSAEVHRYIHLCNLFISFIFP